ncbi:MAG: RDD family protein [Rubricoccaceae bacterium]
MDPLASPSVPSVAARADLLKRFLALVIDALVVVALTFVFAFMGTRAGGLGTLLGAAYMLTRDGLPLGNLDGRSVGKRAMKLRPVRLDGRPMDLETSIRRNWPLVLGSLFSGLGALLGGGLGAIFGGFLGALAGLLGLVEAVLVLVDRDGRRIGDKLAGTHVLETDE